MLDLFSIFTKGGMVLWYFQGTAMSYTPAVNALIKSVILQERGGLSAFNYEALTLRFKVDNELELMFVVVYQKILQLSYVDKLLDQVHLAFRDKYKNELAVGAYKPMNFTEEFNLILRRLEEEIRIQTLQPRMMKSFEQSKKAEKSLQGIAKPQRPEAQPSATVELAVDGDVEGVEECGPTIPSDGTPRDREKALAKLGTRRRGRNGVGKKPAIAAKKPVKPAKRVKEATKWDGVVSREEAQTLDYSPSLNGEGGEGQGTREFQPDYSLVGKMKGELKSLESDPVPATPQAAETTKPAANGIFSSFFKSLTGGKTITRAGMDPLLERMKEHLITKNVAAEIADKLCESVASKLDGKVIGTFRGIQSTVRASMEESLVQILSPKRRVDILRDVMDARSAGRPYTITFCGVNGVGKSTNLAKICFWLLENGLRVLIAACDTFRSGAVEQLRTHTSHLCALHPPEREGGPANVMLYERGYGKDAAGIAMEAIHYAHQQHYDVVLVDTAGRMQDNEPLMRALAKLIRVNSPDLVLFVGEALVGNEAVDQLDKFNRALVDHSDDQNPRVIDGILLTKFDTIDDKVGAAISMTYTTGQPIVFVGTGQTYTDLRSLNVQAVVSALLK